MSLVFHAILIAVGIYLAVCAAHFCVFAVIAQVPAATFPPLQRSWRPVVAVLIPAWKEGHVLVRCVRSLLANDYPGARLEVVVIAQQLEGNVLAALKALPVSVCIDDRVPNTKANALRVGLASLSRRVDYVAVMDADNLAEPDFLIRCVEALEFGFPAVQGLRLEKNRNSWIARLEGAMERINHAIYRRARSTLGLPAGLAGSGMMFERTLLESVMARVDAVGGFDKQLEAELILAGSDVAWVEQAVIYDEKVDDWSAFVGQKRRWVSAQFVFLRRYAGRLLASGFTGGGVAPLDKVLQWSAPPRMVLLMSLFAAPFVCLAIGQPVAAAASASVAVSMSLCAVLALRATHAPWELWWAVLWAPLGALTMLLATMTSAGADKRFIHTGHRHAVDLDEMRTRD